MYDLKDESLFHEDALIGGEWRSAAAGRKIEVIDPAMQGVLGTVPDMDGSDTPRGDRGGGECLRAVAQEDACRTRRLAGGLA
ncbi:hypothetical protein LP421_30325 (plasmid) [Rhizobium sp. RCAM05350]|nr:hypothetical protein LP421_30325 [Rhizobium sp. RCAM05350]